MHWKTSRPGWNEGATAVETAITISLSLALVFGIIEFGMALWQANTMALAVEEAGRYVMVNNNACNTANCAETQMKNTLSSYGGLVTPASEMASSGVTQAAIAATRAMRHAARPATMPRTRRPTASRANTNKAPRIALNRVSTFARRIWPTTVTSR